MNSKPVAPADKEAIAQNAKIDKMIKNDKKTMDRTIKILLLGTQSRRTLSFCAANTQRAMDGMLKDSARCWRIGKINDHQANANYPLWRIP